MALPGKVHYANNRLIDDVSETLESLASSEYRIQRNDSSPAAHLAGANTTKAIFEIQYRGGNIGNVQVDRSVAINLPQGDNLAQKLREIYSADNVQKKMEAFKAEYKP